MSNRFVPGSKKPTLDKAARATLNYSWRWTKWLAGDTIATFAVSAKGVNVLHVSLDGDVVTAMISGGKVGVEATATCEITTVSSPQKIEVRTLYLTIVPR